MQRERDCRKKEAEAMRAWLQRIDRDLCPQCGQSISISWRGIDDGSSLADVCRVCGCQFNIRSRGNRKGTA